MANKPYLVRNTRPRRGLRLLGRFLASKYGGGSTDLWLTEEEFNSSPVQKNIAQSRLEVVVRPKVEVPAEPAPVVTEEVPPEPTPEPEPAAEPEPVTEETVQEPPVDEAPAEEPESAEEAPEPAPVVEEPEVVDPEPVLETEPVEIALDDLEYEWSFSELEALPYRKVQSVARHRGLKTSGKEVAIIERILEAQGE
jgi:hypothetical protein